MQCTLPLEQDSDQRWGDGKGVLASSYPHILTSSHTVRPTACSSRISSHCSWWQPASIGGRKRTRGSERRNRVGELVVKETAALAIGEHKAAGTISRLKGLHAAIQPQGEGTKAPGNGGEIGSGSPNRTFNTRPGTG